MKTDSSKTKAGIFLAVLAAALYAINAPCSKVLLEYMPSTLMAGLLYLGARLGLMMIGGCPAAISRCFRKRKQADGIF